MSHELQQPHTHLNNTVPPSSDTTLIVISPTHSAEILTLEKLQQYPRQTVVMSLTTDHGIHGPYQFEGASLTEIIADFWPDYWTEVVIESSDRFGCHLSSAEIAQHPVILCYQQEGEPLALQNGLVRLIVPHQKSALYQIKWVRLIRILNMNTD